MSEVPGRELPARGDAACYACAPQHPTGPRLRFHDDGERTRARVLLDERHAGDSRQRVHAAFAFLALDEAIAWCARARFGGPAVGEGDSHFVLHAAPATGYPFFVEAWRVGPVQEEGWWRFQATLRQEGHLKAKLYHRMRPLDEDALLEATRDAGLPESLRREAAEALERRRALPPR